MLMKRGGHEWSCGHPIEDLADDGCGLCVPPSKQESVAELALGVGLTIVGLVVTVTVLKLVGWL